EDHPTQVLPLTRQRGTLEKATQLITNTAFIGPQRYKTCQPLEGHSHPARHPIEQSRAIPVREISVISGEKLIAPITAQRDRDVRPRDASEQKCWKRREVGDRLVQLCHDLGKQRQVIRCQPCFAVSRTAVLRDLPGELQLAVGSFPKTNRKGQWRR